MARDAPGGKTGVARTALEIPAVPRDRLRLSSLMIVGHAEPRAMGEPGPLLYQGMQLYPNLGDPHRAGGGQPLAFLFSVRAGGRPVAEATVELLRDGTSVLQSPVALPAPDETGQMRVVGGLDVARLDPGPYVMRLRVASALGFETRSVPFRLGP